MKGVRRVTNTVPTSQAARLLNLSPRRVIQLHAEGRIRATFTPLGRLFDIEEVERFAREREAARNSTQTA